MPELPDLEVIREVLGQHLPGLTITSVDVRRPLIVRNLLGGDMAGRLVGRRFTRVGRRGKFLLWGIEGGIWLVVNPMLAGRIRFGEPLARHRVRDAVVIGLSGGLELRYHDAVDMGKIYLTADLDQAPGFAGQGPEANDPALTLAAFTGQLRGRSGEIKGILKNQQVVAGIGNAYADEILWAAGIYPFRRRRELDDAEIARIHCSMQAVLASAIAILRERVGDAIEVEVRDFLSVHGKPGQPCPRCGSTISEVQLQGVATHFCRTCQPGLMVGRPR